MNSNKYFVDDELYEKIQQSSDLNTVLSIGMQVYSRLVSQIENSYKNPKMAMDFDFVLRNFESVSKSIQVYIHPSRLSEALSIFERESSQLLYDNSQNNNLKYTARAIYIGFWVLIRNGLLVNYQDHIKYESMLNIMKENLKSSYIFYPFFKKNPVVAYVYERKFLPYDVSRELSFEYIESIFIRTLQSRGNYPDFETFIWEMIFCHTYDYPLDRYYQAFQKIIFNWNDNQLKKLGYQMFKYIMTNGYLEKQVPTQMTEDFYITAMANYALNVVRDFEPFSYTTTARVIHDYHVKRGNYQEQDRYIKILTDEFLKTLKPRIVIRNFLNDFLQTSKIAFQYYSFSLLRSLQNIYLIIFAQLLTIIYFTIRNLVFSFNSGYYKKIKLSRDICKSLRGGIRLLGYFAWSFARSFLFRDYLSAVERTCYSIFLLSLGYTVSTLQVELNTAIKIFSSKNYNNEFDFWF